MKRIVLILAILLIPNIVLAQGTLYNYPHLYRGMRSLGALPDDLVLDRKNLRNKVRGILVSHAHLDHVGGVPYVAHRYNAPVLGTPFTMEVLKTLLEDNNLPFANRAHNNLFVCFLWSWTMLN